MLPIPLRPDDGTFDRAPTVAPADHSAGSNAAWTWITNQIDAIPAWTWAVALGVLTIATITLIPLLQTQSYKAGQRAAGRTEHAEQDRKDRRLLIGALIPTVFFWLAVLLGSGRGLIAFGRDDLNWHGGWEYLVPATLDGVAISFGLLAFRAVRKERSPDRAVRIAASAMLASSGINFLHEVGGSTLGAVYLAILSILGMLIFDELLAQFEEGAAHIKRDYPKFGLRWITWPTNTVCAWFAWRNRPPEEDLDASIRNAVQHLETVRQGKARDRAAKVDVPAWWMTIAPWARSAQLETALTEHRTELAGERQLRINLAADVERLRAEHDQMAAEAGAVHRTEMERLRSEMAEQINTLRAEHAERVSRIREKTTAAPTGTPARTSAKTAPTTTAAEPRLTNDEAVALMLQEHPDAGYEWGTREVHRLTGAGFGRVPKLIAAVREHHDRNAGRAARNTPEDDAKEQSA